MGHKKIDFKDKTPSVIVLCALFIVLLNSRIFASRWYLFGQEGGHQGRYHKVLEKQG